MTEAILALLSIDHLVSFCAGVAATCAWHFFKARRRREILVIKWQYIATPVVVALAVYMAAETQQNADCVREFQQVLRDRSAVSTENDQISIAQRKLLYNWIHALVFPPPEIAKLPGGDPVREKWAIDLTLQTDKQFRASLDEQRENDEYRAAHPLPPPRCGE